MTTQLIITDQIIRKTEHKNREGVDTCPIMKKAGYSGKNTRCSHIKLRNMIPNGTECCCGDSGTCLLVKIPGHGEYDNLLEEVLCKEYYKQKLDEGVVRKQIISYLEQSSKC